MNTQQTKPRTTPPLSRPAKSALWRLVGLMKEGKPDTTEAPPQSIPTLPLDKS